MPTSASAAGEHLHGRQQRNDQKANADQITSLANLSRWAFLLTFAGVGLRMNFREMMAQGMRPFIVGALGEVAIAVITLGLVLGASALVKI